MMQSDFPGKPAARPVLADRRSRSKSTLPDQRTLLSWLFAGRVVLAIGILLGAGLVSTQRPQESYIVSTAVLGALALTIYGAWAVFLRDRQPTNGFLLLQAIIDLSLVTLVIYF